MSSSAIHSHWKDTPDAPRLSCTYFATKDDKEISFKRLFFDSYQRKDDYFYVGRLTLRQGDFMRTIRVHYVSSSLTPESELAERIFQFNENQFNFFKSFLSRSEDVQIPRLARVIAYPFFCCSNRVIGAVRWLHSLGTDGLDIQSQMDRIENL